MVEFVNKVNLGTVNNPFIHVIQSDLQYKNGTQQPGPYFTALFGSMKQLFHNSLASKSENKQCHTNESRTFSRAGFKISKIYPKV